jgi:hypothetical protein
MTNDLFRTLFGPDLHEDQLTEILAAVLQYPEYRLAFCCDVLGLRQVEVDTKTSVETQPENETAHGQPDVRIPLRKSFVLVENKLAAGFTPNQPGEYIKEVKNKHGKFLVIQVPKRRLAWARSECGDNPLICLVTWEQTLLALGKVRARDSVGQYLGESLISLLQNVLPKLPYPLQEETMTILRSPDYWQATTDLFNLMAALRKVMSDRGWVFKANKEPFAKGGFFKKGDRDPWVGFFPLASTKHGTGDLWFQYGVDLESREAKGIRKMKKKVFDANQFDGWGGILVPLAVVKADTIEQQAEKLADEIEQMTK